MKRTTAAILMLGGLGGCATPDKGTAEGARPFNMTSRGQAVANVQGTRGEPVAVKQASATGKPGSGVVQADAPGTIDNMVSPVAGSAAAGGVGSVRVNGCADGSCGTGARMGGNGLSPYGPTTSGFANLIGHGAGILPVPAMGAAGAVAFPAGAAVGPGSGMYAGMYAPGRTSVRFANPAGMKITWQAAGGAFPESGLEAPSRYNFPQMQTYRLRLSGIPNRPGKNFYPTLEVYGATPKTITYLSHNAVPVAFTDEDFERVAAGNLVVKVIYLPDEKFQDIAAVAGAEELVSTSLEPGANPVEEANRRGTILAVIRIGNIDLQDPNGPAIDAPVGGMPGPVMMPARPMMAPGAMVPPASLMPSTTPVSVPGAMPATLPSGLKPATPAPVLGAKPLTLPK